MSNESTDESLFHTAELAAAVAGAKCVLFVGSGLSKHTHSLPTWSDFVESIWRNLSDIQDKRDDLSLEYIQKYPLEYLDYAKAKFPNRYYKAIEKELQVLSGGPTPEIYKIIASLPWAAIITTNLDTLLEDAFKQQGVEAIVVDNEEDLSNSGFQDGTLIIKMHGSVRNPSSQVMSRFEYLDFDYRRHGMKAIVLSLFTQYPLLILGAGLTDPNFLKIYGIAHEVMNKFKHKAFYVGYGIPRFVRQIWREKRFEFIKIPHDKLEGWSRQLKQHVEHLTESKISKQPSSFLNLYLKEAAMLSLMEVLSDYKAIQQRYLDNVHIPDYGWFSEPWEQSLYGKLRLKVLEVLQNSKQYPSQKLSFLYLAPGPHAPLFSNNYDVQKEFKKIIGSIALIDILPGVIISATSNLNLVFNNSNIGISSLVEDFTGGCGDRFCRVLNDLVSSSSDTAALLAKVSGTDELLQRIFPADLFSTITPLVAGRIAAIRPSAGFDVVYSEMVASFMGTAPIMGFRSAVFLKFSSAGFDCLKPIMDATDLLWRRFNDFAYDLHLHILSELARPGGTILVATDIKKLFDAQNIASSNSFTTPEPAISAESISRNQRFEETFLWRDHAVGFDIKIAGIAVKDFLRHQHVVKLFVYHKK
ncbi:MAG TPA: SIR2 family protein [Puia sp.]|jgi:hypothetical protein|nr:SIR2 family protein [Puia sp.]